MAEKTTKKNTKVKAAEKKVTPKTTKATKSTKTTKTAKVAEKKVTKKVEVKKTPVKKENKTGKLESMKGKIAKLWNKIISNRPFAIALCIILVLAIALTIVLFTKRIPKTSDGKQIVATIKGKTITADDLYIALKDEYGTNELVKMIDQYITKKEVTFTKENEEYIQGIVDEWKEQAENYGMTLPELVSNYGLYIDSDAEFYDYLKENYSASLAIVKFVGDQASENDLKDFYEANYSDEIKVRHILIQVDEDEDEAKEKAQDLIDELKGLKGDELEEKFIELAKDNSDDSGSYANGGLVEGVTKSTVVEEFFEASNELKDGEYTKEPVKSSYGYHVILRLSATPVKAYKDIKDDVKKAYAEKLISSDPDLQTTKWDELRKSYKLNIVDTDINNAYESKYSK